MTLIKHKDDVREEKRFRFNQVLIIFYLFQNISNVKILEQPRKNVVTKEPPYQPMVARVSNPNKGGTS